jgi:hypothetical protein
MATKVKIDGIDFEIPDGTYTAAELQQKAGLDNSAIPVIRRKDKDIIIEPNEAASIGGDDQIIFTTPMEAACV